MVENARAFQMHCASASWLKVDQFDFVYWKSSKLIGTHVDGVIPDLVLFPFFIRGVHRTRDVKQKGQSSSCSFHALPPYFGVLCALCLVFLSTPLMKNGKTTSSGVAPSACVFLLVCWLFFFCRAPIFSLEIYKFSCVTSFRKF